MIKKTKIKYNNSSVIIIIIMDINTTNITNDCQCSVLLLV